MRVIPRPFSCAPSSPVRDSFHSLSYESGITGAWSRTIPSAVSNAARVAAGSVVASAVEIALSKSGLLQRP